MESCELVALLVYLVAVVARVAVPAHALPLPVAGEVQVRARVEAHARTQQSRRHARPIVARAGSESASYPVHP